MDFYGPVPCYLNGPQGLIWSLMCLKIKKNHECTNTQDDVSTFWKIKEFELVMEFKEKLGSFN